MHELEIEAKNVDTAIEQGLKQLNLTKDEVTIKILDEGSSGLFGLGAKPARVLITNGKKSIPPEVDINYALNKAKEVTTELFARLNIALNKINAQIKDDFLNVEIETPNGNLVIGKGGQTLDSLEYILQLILNNDPKSRLKINLDTENYRNKQRGRLEVLAQKALNYVKRTGKIYRFDPMCAKERKMIHSYLKSYPEIETFSDGHGNLRKVAIKRAAK
jgi:spoIIIJ-associated protein